MRIGIIKETKVPEDNRVALTPRQAKKLMEKYPQCEVIVESSDIRIFSDEEYRKEGIKVVKDMGDCDVLIGIKEPNITSLLPNKHYIFFGHFAKMQEYNRPLLQALMSKHITFSDYEYLVDDNNKRVCAFGWWAGIVGLYYTIRGYAIRNGNNKIPMPDFHFTLSKLFDILSSIDLPDAKILITGNGRVSKGAQYALYRIGAKRLSKNDFLSKHLGKGLSYYVAEISDLVKSNFYSEFDKNKFYSHPEKYRSDFMKWAEYTDILLSCHYWDPKAPVYLSSDNLKNPHLRIKMIGDITCDIKGCLMSTVRSSSHQNPYYDYNVLSEKEETPFSSNNNITVMAVDTCPNALAMEASEDFGQKLIDFVFDDWLRDNQPNATLKRSTILQNGNLTDKFSYLSEFAQL